jgi:hypothetical protein
MLDGADAAHPKAYRQAIGELTPRLQPFIELAAQAANLTRNTQKETSHG